MGVFDNSSSQSYVVPLDWAEPSPAIISTSKICHIDNGWHARSNISPGFSSKSNSFNSFSRFFFASISLSLFRYLCKNFQSTLFTLLCHPCHLCFTCWGGEKFLDKTLFATFSKATAVCWFSLSPSPAVLKAKNEHKFPQQHPIFHYTERIAFLSYRNVFLF